ncbi:MAG: exodeoxyribonuclease V subunit beta [Gammaproteobacteria bacterium]|nr:exodeoxyribonuclease V subunit beta [Gammaproteobacteria bacterium]
MAFQKLDVATLPLSGRHLIEASAGTGKTFNITRLYLRLLLEKQISVQNILVMTFTKAATQELRGRIDSELRNALSIWENEEKATSKTIPVADPFYLQLKNTYTKEQAELILKPALLELDEAAIYTIHGFCIKALKNQAFASRLPLDMSMETDTDELLNQCTYDWFRLINQKPEKYELLQSMGWHTPESFLSKFKFQALKNQSDICLPEYDFNEQSVLLTKAIIKDKLTSNQPLLDEYLQDKEKEIEDRQSRYQQLLSWLIDQSLDACPEYALKFINGSKLRAKKFQELKDILYDVREQLENTNKQIKKLLELPAYELAIAGILKIRQDFAALKQQQLVMDFDDLIQVLSDRLSEPQAQPLIDSLRQQYPFALVDEFQDTDPKQYQIIDILYPQSFKKEACANQALFMIGDPKQAIYAFRGGDIFTYLKARENADYLWYMEKNWRSLQGVVEAYNHLFSMQNNVFGEDIGYQSIEYSDSARAASYPLVDNDDAYAFLNYVYLDKVNGSDNAVADEWKSGLARCCALEIKRLLNNSASVYFDHKTDEGQIKRAVHERDIAILVRTGREAKLIQDTLRNYSLLSVYLSNKESIYLSVEATELLFVMRGILDCENRHLLIAALSTHLINGSAQFLADLHHDEALWETQLLKARELRTKWQKQGFMAMVIVLIKESYQPDPGTHERSLTNMLHLAELIQHASIQYQQPRQLLKWFDEQITQNSQSSDEQAQLRLESDQNLIQIVTMHGCKGLEYPIVFVPFASYYKSPVANNDVVLKYYDHKKQHSVVQIGVNEQAQSQALQEGHAESARLLYVAVTRASHRCYLGISPFENNKSANASELSPLGQLLKLKSKAQWQEKLELLIEGNSRLIDASALLQQSISHAQVVEVKTKDDLFAQSFNHPSIDESWMIRSFTSLSRSHSIYIHRLDKQDDIDDGTDEPKNLFDPGLLPLRFNLKKGADSGNLLHEIFEKIDFSCNEYGSAIYRALSHFPQTVNVDETGLNQWVQECLNATIPIIGDEAKTFSLNTIQLKQTLRESEFYFPLNQMSSVKLQQCLQKHRGERKNQDNKDFHPLNSSELNGMMRGFIDLIFEYQGKYYVADYKSTHLGHHFSDYQYQHLKANNEKHLYDLQYLIYSLALHRYLQKRLSDYEPGKHFGGVYYLYLRGMSSGNKNYEGVYYTGVSEDLLAELDAIVDGAEQ